MLAGTERDHPVQRRAVFGARNDDEGRIARRRCAFDLPDVDDTHGRLTVDCDTQSGERSAQIVTIASRGQRDAARPNIPCHAHVIQLTRVAPENQPASKSN